MIKMSALDKFNRDQIIEDMKRNDREFLYPQKTAKPNEEPGAIFANHDIESGVFASITGLNEPRMPQNRMLHNRMLDDRPPKIRRGTHRYKHFAWDDPNEEEVNDGLW